MQHCVGGSGCTVGGGGRDVELVAGAAADPEEDEEYKSICLRESEGRRGSLETAARADGRREDMLKGRSACYA